MIKDMLMTAAAVIVALIVYDMVVSKFLLPKDSYEADYEEA